MQAGAQAYRAGLSVTAADPAKARPLLEIAVECHRDALGDDDEHTHNSLIALGGPVPTVSGGGGVNVCKTVACFMSVVFLSSIVWALLI